MSVTDIDQADHHRSLPVPSLARNEMDELLKCFICFDRVQDAHLCPACSSMCCRECIVKWLTERKAQCPHCQVELRVEHLVNCRFVQDLTKAVDRLQSSICHSRELCPIHRNELLYFCINCSKCICADCAMFSSVHSGHSFEKLGVVHERHARAINAEILNLESRLASLRQVEASIDANIAAVNAAKDDAIYALQTLAQQMEKNIMQQLKAKLLILDSQRNEVSKELSLLESVVHELGCHLDPAICPKSELIRKSEHLSAMTKSIYEKPLSTLICRQPVSDSFASELIPDFTESSFTIENFMGAVSREEVLYSDVLFRNGYNWRLKVYPNGNGASARGVYISVFLELITGLPGSEQIEYAVQMVNHKDPSKAITRRFCSKFEVGESWGYNKFFAIEVLYRDGYLSEDGSLSLKFFIRPPSMHLANLEQQKYIAALERAQAHYKRTVRELKSHLSSRGLSHTSISQDHSSDIAPELLDHHCHEDETASDSEAHDSDDSNNNQDQSESESSENLECMIQWEASIAAQCEDNCQTGYDAELDVRQDQVPSNSTSRSGTWNYGEEVENIPELDNIERLCIDGDH